MTILGKREVLGWVVSLILCGLWLSTTITPVPYRNVEVVSVVDDAQYTYFVANFEKTDCEFRRLETIGNLSGVNEFIPWVDPTRADNDYLDRMEGGQTITLTISGTASHYDWIEIRTRHFCPDPEGPDVEYDENGNATNGLYVDGVFYRITSRDLPGATS